MLQLHNLGLALLSVQCVENLTSTIGAAALGIVALTLLLALLRALAHNRALEMQLTQQTAHA